MKSGGRIVAVLALAVQFQLCMCIDAMATEQPVSVSPEHGSSCHAEADEKTANQPESNQSGCCCDSEGSYIHGAKSLAAIPSAGLDNQENVASHFWDSSIGVAEKIVLKSVTASDPPLAQQSAPFLSLRI